MLWVVGDSIAHGIGIAPNQRFGIILGTWLDSPVNFLTAPGSSIMWAADTVCKVQFEPNDIIVWLLTHPNRIFQDGNHLGVWNYHDLDYLDSNELRLLNEEKILEVIEYCGSKHTNLFIFNYLKDYWDYLSPSTRSFINDISIIKMGGKQFIDVGSDGTHPGELTHYKISELMHKVIV